MRTIELIQLKERVTENDVLRIRDSGQLIACDFYIDGIENGEDVTGGYGKGRIVNIDHHAPTPRMCRPVSSANLAIEHLRIEQHSLAGDAVVVLNHLDCDSIVTAGILTGRLPVDPRFGEAAIAADHTGAEDEIADLLQGIDGAMSSRGIRDVALPMSSLQRHLEGGMLDRFALEALENRRRKRSLAEALAPRFQQAGRLHYAVTNDGPIDGEFFPALLPGAVVIMIANRFQGIPDRWQVKIRLGLQAPPGFSLSDLGIRELDPVYGGRWNAGSNRRGGGTVLAPDAYAERLSALITESIGEIRS